MQTGKAIKADAKAIGNVIIDANLRQLENAIASGYHSVSRVFAEKRKAFGHKLAMDKAAFEAPDDKTNHIPSHS